MPNLRWDPSEYIVKLCAGPLHEYQLAFAAEAAAVCKSASNARMEGKNAWLFVSGCTCCPLSTGHLACARWGDGSLPQLTYMININNLLLLLSALLPLLEDCHAWHTSLIRSTDMLRSIV